MTPRPYCPRADPATPGAGPAGWIVRSPAHRFVRYGGWLGGRFADRRPVAECAVTGYGRLVREGTTLVVK